MSNLLEITDLRVRYRYLSSLKAFVTQNADPFLDAVLNVTLSLKEGETLAIVGESGSGKTTLARAILGLVPIASGTVSFEGRTVKIKERNTTFEFRRNVAYIPQDPIASLSPRLTVKSLLVEPFKIFGLPISSAAREAQRLLELVQLPASFLTRYPHELSGGQARRIGIARALALNPKLVIADEPTAGLDVSVQGGILNLLLDLQSQFRISFLFITHNLAVARHTSDRTAVMYLGRIVEIGETANLFARPAHPYSQGLVSSAPEIQFEDTAPKAILRGETPSLLHRPLGCEFRTRCFKAAARCSGDAPLLKPLDASRWARCHFPYENLVQ